ncbi:DUF6264 family protein [Frigoribacterium sp. PhB24]|uniref:DUF6264 family protein n=1 Tax=Frigoribacterium sp. PhB24 TaxID=2485204 RepID=UPI000F46EDF8|nr:DUF6264 family protein [Frigoribacterium sp. PhB24]ROS51508.1 hypothetical protein EDF50_1824 [Frigoribacterium sp. PhB24]
MTDERPKPRYGEYAPEGWVNPVTAADDTAEEARVAEQDARPALSTDVRAGDETRTAPPALTTGRRVDRVATFALIGLGAFGAIQAIARVPGYATTQLAQFETFGLDLSGFGSSAALQTFGTVMAVVAVTLFSVSTWWTLRRLRAGRLGFVVPLVAGVVFGLIQGFGAAAILMGDPAFAEAMQSFTNDYFSSGSN